MPNTDNNLEAYKIINTKLNQEVDEFYKINGFFLAILSGGLFGQSFLQDKSTVLAFIVGLLGLIISIIWLFVDIKSVIYRNWWVEKAKKFEVDVLSKEKIWVDGKNDPKLKHAHGIWWLVTTVPVFFIISWLAILGLIMYPALCRS